jgi:hypothetical protein
MALGYLAGEIDNDLQATRAAIAITRINLDSGRGAECRTRGQETANTCPSCPSDVLRHTTTR